MNTRLLPYIYILSLFLGVFSSSLSALEKSLAKALWIEFDGAQHILNVADYDGENWSIPRITHISKNPMTSIAIGANGSDSDLLVWTEQAKQKSQLWHKWFSRDTQTWSEAEILSEFGNENIGASIVVDSAGRIQLFWSANTTDFNDIVQMTYSNSRWSAPKVIHPSNEVPDIKPTAGLDLNGNIRVTWSSYSTEAGQYVELEKIIEVNNQSLEQNRRSTPTTTDAIEFEEVTLPSFLPSDSATTIYFPENSIVQSTSISP